MFNFHSVSRRRKIQYSLILSGLSISLFNVSSVEAAALVGKHNETTQQLPQFLFGPNSIPSTLGDDTTLINIFLKEVTTFDFGSIVSPSFICPHNAPGNCNASINFTSTTSYTKSYSTTTSTTINSKISSEFMGIGSELESSFSVGSTVGTEITDSTSIASSFNLPVAPGTKVDWYRDEKWVQYDGTLDYYIDTFGIGGDFTFDDPWSVAFQYNTEIIPVLTNIHVPEPLTIMGTFLALGFGVAMKRKVSQS